KEHPGCVLYSIPYSEHSSYTELVDFLKYVRPQRVVGTVGKTLAERDAQVTAVAGSIILPDHRGRLESYFRCKPSKAAKYARCGSPRVSLARMHTVEGTSHPLPSGAQEHPVGPTLELVLVRLASALSYPDTTVGSQVEHVYVAEDHVTLSQDWRANVLEAF
ncbi:DNA cross-link repair 1A protein, partial [Perkinsus olseni]